MIELEPLGPRERIEPGRMATFTETWELKPFPFPQQGQDVDLAAVQKLTE